MIIDYSQIKKFKTLVRPAHKNNEIYEIKINGKLYWCERPLYIWSKFDQSLFLEAFQKEGKILFDKDVSIFYDQENRQWFGEELTSKYLLKYYTDNPLRYVQVMSERVTKIKEIIQIMGEVNKTIYSKDKEKIIDNFNKIKYCFNLFYETAATVFMLFDDLVYKFKEVLLMFLDKREANTYLCDFLTAEMTKEAIRLGHVEEYESTSRASTYGTTKPVVFYKDPKFFYESKMDMVVFEKVMKSGLSQKLKDEFFALRLIMPIGMQINEEAQYIESKILTAHFGVLINHISEILIAKGIITNKEDINGMKFDEVLKKLENNPDGVDKFIDSMLLAVGNMDYSTVEPMNDLLFHPLFAKEWVEKIDAIIANAEERSIPISTLAEKIRGLSHLRAQFYFVLLDLKSAKIEKEKRVRISRFFHELLMTKDAGDVYGFESNIMHSDVEIKNILKKDFSMANPKIAKLLGALYASAYHYICGLYSDFYADFGVENFGAYDLGDNKILVIKRFPDLNPSKLWKGLKSPCKKLAIYCVYENVKYKSDAISVHSTYEGDPINGMVKYLVEIDDRIVDSEEELIRIKDSLSALAKEQWQKIIALDKEELKQMGLLQRSYVFKKLSDFLEINWKPSKEMINAVKGKDFAIGFWKPPKDNEKEYWKKVLDPNTDFYG